MHFNVLGSSLEERFPSEVNTAHVVAIAENQILDGNVDRFLKYPFQPNGFIGVNCRAPVFSLCARECDCRLLFVAPGYSSTAEGENEPQG